MSDNKTRVMVNFIQDRSGSMQATWDETLNGFKVFVENLKKGAVEDNIDYLFSLTTFDTLIECPVAATEIGSVDTGALASHGPRGMTALYDAVGATLKKTEDNGIKADKYIVVIVTDGHENSSREWNKDTLQKAIESRLAAGNWTFTYLGTQPETWGDAGKIGVHSGASATYQAHRAMAAYSVTADAARELSRSKSMGSREMLRSFSPVAARASAGMRLADDPTDAVNRIPAPAPVHIPPQPPAKDPARWR